MATTPAPIRGKILLSPMWVGYIIAVSEGQQATSTRYGATFAAAFSWLVISVGLPPTAVAQGFELSLGLDYSGGDYGETTDTTIVYVPVVLGYTIRNWQLKATLPYLILDGPVDVSYIDEPLPPGGEGPPTSEDEKDSERESGLGDILLAIRYSFDDFYDAGLFLDLTGTVKLPTASVGEGLGTGKFDYTGQIDVAKTLGNWTPLAKAGYRVVGRSSEFDLQDTLIGVLGIGYQFTNTVYGGLTFEYRESLARDGDDPQEILAYIGFPLDEKWSLILYGLAGVSDGSPDVALGASFTFRGGGATGD